MKIRRGFVSNSSSSSFIVAFPKGFVPTHESVKEYLFKNTRAIGSYDTTVSADDATRVILQEMLQQIEEGKVSDSEAIRDAMGGYLDGAPDFLDYRDESKLGYDWEAYQAATEKFVTEYFEKFRGEAGDSDLYVFSFSDNDGGFWCALEHGGTFDEVKHLAISHH